MDESQAKLLWRNSRCMARRKLRDMRRTMVNMSDADDVAQDAVLMVLEGGNPEHAVTRARWMVMDEARREVGRCKRRRRCAMPVLSCEHDFSKVEDKLPDLGLTGEEQWALRWRLEGRTLAWIGGVLNRRVWEMPHRMTCCIPEVCRAMGWKHVLKRRPGGS